MGKPWRIAYFGDAVLDLRNLSLGIWCIMCLGYKKSRLSDRNRILREFVSFRSLEWLSAPTKGIGLTRA